MEVLIPYRRKKLHVSLLNDTKNVNIVASTKT